MKYINFGVIVFLAFVQIGCAWFTSPMEQPIIEDHSHDRKVTTFSTIASRRMVVLTQVENGQLIVCAEPSPDVSDNLASSLAIAASGSGPLTSNKEITTSISNSLTTSAQHLFKRTQGMQFYRDGMYNLCQARMSGIIDNVGYLTAASELQKNAIEMIKMEIPNLLQSSSGENSVPSNKGGM